MKDTRDIVADRFKQALHHYCGRLDLSADALADKWQIHRATVHRWMSGKTLPSQRKLQWAVAQMGIDHTRLFTTNLPIGALYERLYLSFDDLNAQCIDAAVLDLASRPSVLAVATAQLFSFLQRRSMPCVMAITHKYEARIGLAEPLNGLVIALQLQNGIEFCMVNTAGNVPAALKNWIALSDANVDLIIPSIQNWKAKQHG